MTIASKVECNWCKGYGKFVIETKGGDEVEINPCYCLQDQAPPLSAEERKGRYPITPAEQLGRCPDARPSKGGAMPTKDETLIPFQWRPGAPPHPWDTEWFVAETTYGDRVVLVALPEDYFYDFKTADETHIKRDKIKCWAQFPDSEFIAAPLD